MTTLDPTTTQPGEIRFDGRRRPSTATLLGTIALVGWLVPAGVTTAIGTTAPYAGIDPKVDPDGFLSAVAANPGPWTLGAIGLLLTALLTIAWVPAVWRLAVAHSRGWAWAAAALGALLVFGQAVHLMAWTVLMPALAAAGTSGEQAAAILGAIEGTWLFWVIFAPYLLGFLLAAPVAAIALWRARVLPAWAPVAVGAAALAGVGFGDSLVGGLLWTALTVAGFAPALRHVIRRRG